MKKKKDIEHIVLADDTYQYAGVPIILKKTEAWVDNGEYHTLIIGGTGGGKTECIIKPLTKILAKAGESMIITDPKAEIYEETAGLLKAKGYKIIVINFRDTLKGNCWNPLTLPYKFFKEGRQDKTNELLSDLAINILIDPNNKAEPFWEQTASDYFKGLALGLFEDAKEDEINFNSLNLMSTYGELRYHGIPYSKLYFDQKGYGSEIYNSVTATIDGPADTKNSILSTFKSKMSIFTTNNVLSEMLSKSDFDFDKIGMEKTAIFLCIHDEKKTYHSLMTTFIKQAYESLIAQAQACGGKLPVRTNFLLDEFANMPALKDVDTMISAARSRNIRFDFVIQNFSQLNQVYGADMAETIKGNCGNVHFLSTAELKALEEFSKLCGDKKPKKNKENRGFFFNLV